MKEVDAMVSLDATFSMMFTMPIVESAYEATETIILESYSALEGGYNFIRTIWLFPNSFRNFLDAH